MKIRHLAVFAACATFTSAVTVHAQVFTMTPAGDTGHAPKPVLSPRDTTRATIGAATVTVDYGRPSKRGRAIFGTNTLVPYDKVWRAGANAATTFQTSADLMIGGVAIPAGTYTLYALPSSTSWQLIINKETGQWGTKYDQTKDLARIPMKVTSLSTPVEKFEITIPGDGMLHLRWDTVDASVSIAAK